MTAVMAGQPTASQLSQSLQKSYTQLGLQASQFQRGGTECADRLEELIRLGPVLRIIDGYKFATLFDHDAHCHIHRVRFSLRAARRDHHDLQMFAGSRPAWPAVERDAEPTCRLQCLQVVVLDQEQYA